MNYQHIEIESIPKLLFSHMYETDNYLLSFPPKENILELCYVEKGDIEYIDSRGVKAVYKAPCLIPFFHDEFCTFSSPAPLHRHITIGLELKWKRSPISREQLQALLKAFPENESTSFYTVLPDYMPDDEKNTIAASFRRLAYAATQPDIAANIRWAGMVLQFLSDISRECVCRKIVSEETMLPDSNALYCRRAIEYISKNIQRRITVDDLASHLRISGAHLSRLFKSYTGRTLIEYINALKMNKVKELVTEKKIPLREAGMQMGYDDEQYVSRLFKKYFGISFREFFYSLQAH